MEKFEYDGIDVWYRYLHDPKSNMSTRNTCFFTKKELLVSEGFYLIMNNFKIFPNICVDKAVFDTYGIEEICKLAKESWNRLQSIMHDPLLKDWDARISFEK